jgi:hypothetical protein
MESININNKLDLITDLWKPRVIAELNGQHVKISKVKGKYCLVKTRLAIARSRTVA